MLGAKCPKAKTAHSVPIGSFAGSTEVDTLTGGAGNNIFVLSSGDTLFYSGNGNADFAKITEIGNGADQIFSANGNYANNDDITKLFAIKADGSLDLIAKIAYAQGSSSISQRQSSAVALSDAIVNPLLTNTTFSLSQRLTWICVISSADSIAVCSDVS